MSSLIVAWLVFHCVLLVHGTSRCALLIHGKSPCILLVHRISHVYCYFTESPIMYCWFARSLAVYCQFTESPIVYCQFTGSNIVYSCVTIRCINSLVQRKFQSSFQSSCKCFQKYFLLGLLSPVFLIIVKNKFYKPVTSERLKPLLYCE